MNRDTRLATSIISPLAVLAVFFTIGAEPVPVARWTFEEADGNLAADVTGHGHQGTMHSVTRAATPYGKAASFDGSSGAWIEIADNADFKQTQALSIEAFLTVKALPGEHGIVFFRGDNTWGTDPYYLSVQPDQTILFHIEQSTGVWANLETPIELNKQMHVVATFSAADKIMKIYINGKLASSLPTDLTPLLDLPDPSSDGVSIGNHVYPGEHYFPFTGTIDELAFYDQALDSQTVQRHYTAATPAAGVGFGLPTLYAKPGEEIWFPVYISNKDITRKITACTIAIAIDSSLVSFTGATTGQGICPDWVLSASATQKNQIVLAASDTNAPRAIGSGELLRFKLKVRPSARPDDSSPIVFRNISVNEGGAAVGETRDGKLFVTGPVGVRKEAVKSLGSNDIMIQRSASAFVLHAAIAGPLTVSLFDVKGRSVFSRHYPAGMDARVPLNGLTGGMYLVSVRNKERVLNRPVMVE